MQIHQEQKQQEKDENLNTKSILIELCAEMFFYFTMEKP